MKRIITIMLILLCAVGLCGTTADAAKKKKLNLKGVSTEKQVTLTWKKAGADYYKVLKSTNGSKYKEIATIKGKRKYTDKKVKKNNEYTYRVVGYKNVNGKTKAICKGELYVVLAYVEEEFDTEELCCFPKYSPTCIELRLDVDNDADSGITQSGCELQRRKVGTKKWSVVKKWTTKDNDLIKDTSVEAGQAYDYRLRTYWKRKGKKTYSRYSDTLRRYAVNHVDEAKLKMTLVTPENIDTDTITIKLENDINNGAIILKRKDIYFDISPQNATNNIRFKKADWSYEGKTWSDLFVAHNNEQIILEPGKEMYIRFKTENGEKLHFYPSQYTAIGIDMMVEYCDHSAMASLDLKSKAYDMKCLH